MRPDYARQRAIAGEFADAIAPLFARLDEQTAPEHPDPEHAGIPADELEQMIREDTTR